MDRSQNLKASTIKIDKEIMLWKILEIEIQ